MPISIFSKGSFKQKNIFGQYNFKENYRGDTECESRLFLRAFYDGLQYESL